MPSTAKTFSAKSIHPAVWPTAAVALGALLLGLAPILVRWSEFGYQATAFWRFVFALPALTILALATRGESTVSAPDRRLLAVAGACFGIDIALWHAALGLTTVVNATLLSNMAPVLAAAAGWLFFRQRLTPLFLAGAAVAIVGAALLSIGRAQGGQGSLAGDLVGLSSAIAYAGYLVLLQRLRARVPVWTAMAGCTAAALVIAAAATVIAGEAFLPPGLDWRAWAGVIALGLVVHAGGQGLIAWGIGGLPIARSTFLLFLQPVAAAALSWIALGEPLGVVALLGAALVLVGVAAVQRARR